MFFARFNINGQETAQLYDDWATYHHDTFNPETRFISLIDFHAHGNDYQSRKESVRTLAIDWSNEEKQDVDFCDQCDISNWFYKYGKRFGLLEEFRENLIC